MDSLTDISIYVIEEETHQLLYFNRRSLEHSKMCIRDRGMTIVKNLVSMMGGDIQVESRYGKGSKFQVTLCLTKCGAPAPVTPTEMTGKRNAFAGIRVLLAEDNELNRQIAVEMLEILGVKVETVENLSLIHI